MRLWNKLSTYFTWLFLSALITVTCVFASFYITRHLTENERRHNRGPHKHHSFIMKSLVASGKANVDEAFRLVEKTEYKELPVFAYLVDGKGNIIDQNFEGSLPRGRDDLMEAIKISDDRYVEYYFRKRGPPGPPPGAARIGAIAVSASIVVGLALSLFFLTLYVRIKSQEAEEVINKLKSGDLKARFKVHPRQEMASLMLRFNEMAEQIESLVSHLRQTEESRKKMLQELAHDLRTPVASLKNFQEILAEKGHLMDDTKKAQVLSWSIKEVAYMERLVEDLLFLSGVNDPRYSGDFAKLELSDLVQEEIELLQEGRAKLSFSPGSGYEIQGDEHLLRRLIKNALSNALRFAREEVRVSLRREENSIILKVSDDGPGMDEDLLSTFGEKKFSRQVDEGEHGHISVGLGSVIMKKIVDLHDGDMEAVNSHPGLEIVFTFPVF